MVTNTNIDLGTWYTHDDPTNIKYKLLQFSFTLTRKDDVVHFFFKVASFNFLMYKRVHYLTPLKPDLVVKGEMGGLRFNIGLRPLFKYLMSSLSLSWVFMINACSSSIIWNCTDTTLKPSLSCRIRIWHGFAVQTRDLFPTVSVFDSWLKRLRCCEDAATAQWGCGGGEIGFIFGPFQFLFRF